MPEIIQRSFTGGEIAPALRSRSDIVKYATGLKLCQNMFPRAQGGVYSRPGTRYTGELSDSTKKARLIPFSFNTEQTYILVFEHLKMRVIRDAGYVLTTGSVIYELTTPYTEAQLSRLGYTQKADVMTIVHPDHDPRDLSRLDHDNWSLNVINYSSNVSAPTGLSVTTVGNGGGTHTKTYYYVITAVNELGEESIASSQAIRTSNSLSTTFGHRISWAAVSGADYYRVYKDPSVNTGVFGWIGDSKTTSFDDFNIAPVTSDAPPENRTPFSGTNNKPATVNYYQQRQVFANTNNERQTVFTTQTGNFSSMRTSSPARDDDAVTFTIAGKQVNEIRHIIALDSMILLTSGGEWRVTEGQDEVLTPATAAVRIQSYNGASWVTPAVINDTIVYVQEKGARIRDLRYAVSSDENVSNDLSIMAEHLFEGHEILEMTYSAEPYGILWLVRDDGVLLGMTYQREHQVWAWHQHVTDGEFESVASISENGRDATYVIVKRTINGSDVRYVERFEPRVSSAAEDVFCVDSGLSYSGAATNTLSGLSHLEGETVVAVADGNVIKDLTVSSGSVSLPYEASKVVIGIPYTPAIELLDIDSSDSQNTLRAKPVTVSEITLEVEDSRGGFIGAVGGSSDDMVEIKSRSDSDGYDAISLTTSELRQSIMPEWGSGGGVRIEQRDPMPLAILSVIPHVSVGG